MCDEYPFLLRSKVICLFPVTFPKSKGAIGGIPFSLKDSVQNGMQHPNQSQFMGSRMLIYSDL